MQYKVIADEIYKNIKKSICSATHDVTEGLEVQKLPERRIKKINKGPYQVRHQLFLFVDAKVNISCDVL